MGRQRNKLQMKEQENFSEEDLDEMEESNLSDKRVSSNDYKDTQQHEKDMETTKKGPVGNKGYNV